MNNDRYYEPDTTRAWDLFIDQWDGEDEPDAADFDDWQNEQLDRAEDAAIERAEAMKEEYEYDGGEW
jgi:hypothetical protein